MIFLPDKPTAKYYPIPELRIDPACDESLIHEMERDRYFLLLTSDISQRSKCLRAQYGSLIVSADSRIVSTGYNGKPRHAINDQVCYRGDFQANAPKPNCCIHSEANAIAFCSPQDRRGGTIYVSGVPCTDCLLLILQSGLSRVVYLEQKVYSPMLGDHSGDTEAEFILKYGVPIEVVGYRTRQIWSDDKHGLSHSFFLRINADHTLVGPYYQGEIHYDRS